MRTQYSWLHPVAHHVTKGIARGNSHNCGGQDQETRMPKPMQQKTYAIVIVVVVVVVRVVIAILMPDNDRRSCCGLCRCVICHHRHGHRRRHRRASCSTKTQEIQQWPGFKEHSEHPTDEAATSHRRGCHRNPDNPLKSGLLLPPRFLTSAQESNDAAPTLLPSYAAS